MMGAKPDVACYAKLLTGGMVPLAATVATEEVFQAFDGPTKVRRRRRRSGAAPIQSPPRVSCRNVYHLEGVCR